VVDFEKLIKDKKPEHGGDLEVLFDSLDRRATHTDLRPAQTSSLKKLSAEKDSRDLILKVSTGSGKTISGLLYLKAHMDRYKEPTVSVCSCTIEGNVLKLGNNHSQNPLYKCSKLFQIVTPA